jgi:hypothetical protein
VFFEIFGVFRPYALSVVLSTSCFFRQDGTKSCGMEIRSNSGASLRFSSAVATSMERYRWPASQYMISTRFGYSPSEVWISYDRLMKYNKYNDLKYQFAIVDV